MVLSSRRNQWLSCTPAVPSESVSVFFLWIAIQKCGKMISLSYSISNIDISRELVFIEKMYYIHYADNGQSWYRGSGVRLPRLAFCFSPPPRPCSALPNSSSIVVRHHSSYKSHVSLGSWVAYAHSTYLKTTCPVVSHSIFSKAIICLGVFLVAPQNLFSIYFHHSL